MSRPVVLSNGELHVGLNKFAMVHDFYYPYVGLENHSAGEDLRHKIGVWVDGTISWLDDGTWDIESWTAEGALIGHTRAVNMNHSVIVEFDDSIDTSISALIRNIHVINNHTETRDIRLFLHQAFAIGDSRSNTDTAQYLPDSNAVLHYNGRRVFVISGVQNDAPFDQHAIGLFGIEGREGTWRDAEDGELSGGNVEHGRVDSTFRFKLHLKPFESKRVHYWIAAGTSLREALYVHKSIQDGGINHHLHSTATWWHSWLEPVRSAEQKLPVQARSLFTHSALVIKAHADKRGAVIASTDTTMLNYSRDAYAYCWPRDGAYALWPLIRLGYISEPRRFFEFARKGLHQNGYLHHKYRADGALGSSWHPYDHGYEVAPPIQEDETALTLFMFGQYYHAQESQALLHEFYEPFVKKMADFVASYIDEQTGLPHASYDLWEENYITSTYTTAIVFASLQSAAELAEKMLDSDAAVRWRTAADDIYEIAHKTLFNESKSFFYKAVTSRDGTIEHDDTIDIASFYGAYMFGLFPIGSNELSKAYETIKTRFFKNDDFGVPRYENDNYHRMDGTGDGNYWFIASLWVAQYANEIGDTQIRDAILAWVENQVDSSNMFAEQLHPESKLPLSVSPLVWSHAEYMATRLDALERDGAV